MTDNPMMPSAISPDSPTSQPTSFCHEAIPVLGAAICQHVLVCMGKACEKAGSEKVLDGFREGLKDAGVLFGKRGTWDGTVLVTKTGCSGLCEIGPAVQVYPEGVWYAGVTAKKVKKIIHQHLLAGHPVKALMVKQVGPGVAAN